jgi:hypothetical protein
MSKARAVGVLGALIVGGMVLLSSLAVASDPVPGYFKKVDDAFRRSCRQNSDVAPVCLFLVRVLKPLTPPLFDAGSNTTEEELEDTAVAAFKTKTPGLRRGSDCDECIQAVTDLEVLLATNGTVLDVRDALEMACESRFADPAKATQCREFVAPLPQVIDFLVSNFPPESVCQALKRCPLP